MKSREDVESLKIRWANCPDFILEDVADFEDHEEELTEYRKTWERIWESCAAKHKVVIARLGKTDPQGQIFVPDYIPNRLEYFAGIAMNGIISNSNVGLYGKEAHEDIAKVSIQQAKALIAALDEEK